MELPRLTEQQLMSNNTEFNNLIKNVRALSPSLADLLMQNRNKVDNHVKSLESEIQIIEQFHVAKLRIAERGNLNAVSGIRRG